MSDSQSKFLVVGLGGSAGSIPAFCEFFRQVTPGSGMAYVVVLHLSPHHESHLDHVLQGATSLPVLQVHERVRVQPDHVYVIPPNRSLSMNDGTLEVSEITGFEERRAPIDIFFRTLADTHDSRAVCVILSGSGSDGSAGLRRVKEMGGLVLVQDPSEAEFDEMPRNSIATGLVDFVLPVARMPERMVAFREQIATLPLVLDERAELEEQALIDIFTTLRVRTGHDFANYKRATVLRRIERRMAVREQTELTEYARFLRDRPDEADALLRELLISVTNFFRDRAVWEQVALKVIPRLFEGKHGEDHLRVWVPGCATGEEAYTVAMLLADAASQMASPPDIQIFATDLDEDAIAKARNAFYSVAETADVPPEQLRRYFIKEQDAYRIRRELRELVLFAHHNVIKDPPFSHLDFVSCRNLLIYLNRTAQERTMEVLHFALEPNGFLLLGSAETVDGASQLFSSFDKESHIYQSRAVPRVVSMATSAPLTVATDLRVSGQPSEVRVESRGVRFAPLDLHQRLLEEYAPPSLIVDEQYNILHLSERAGRYLQFAVGEASLNLLQVIRPELRIELRSALFQAAQKRMMVVARSVSVHTGERAETVNVIVRPMLRESDPARGYFLVLFEQAHETVDVVAHPAASEPAARQLEEELIRIKAQMRATIEQYEMQAEEAKAANEELQAMNEELRSTAEELETSEEELQSVNEELQTVNQELKVKIDEISHANNDMRNLMSSTEIGTIFVDRGLRVKLFTPRIRDIFNLIPADVGRPLLDINSKLTIDNLAADVETVLDRLQTIEREVQTRDGHWHLMRLLPYRTADDRIDGVVLTFVDVTERKRAEEILHADSQRQALLLRLAERTRELENPAQIAAAATEILGRHMRVVRAAYASIDDARSLMRVEGEWTAPGVPPMTGEFDLSVYGPEMIQHYRAGDAWVIEDVGADPRSAVQRTAEMYAPWGARALVGIPIVKGSQWVATLYVIDSRPRVWTTEEMNIVREVAERTWAAVERAQALIAMRRSEEQYRRLFNSIDEAFCIVQIELDEHGRAGDYRFLEINPAFDKQTGTRGAVGRTASELVPGIEPMWIETYAKVAQTGEPIRFIDYSRAMRRWFDVYAFRIGKPEERRVAVLFSDITAREETERALRISEARLQTVANLVPDLLWSNDPAGRADWFNQRWLDYTGQTPDDARGDGWTAVIHPEDRELARSRFEQAIAEGVPLRSEHRVRDANGEYRWFLVQAAPLRDAEGQIVRWFGAATDIHEQRGVRDVLEQRVQVRTRELTDLSAQRQQLLERLVNATEEERQRIARELHDEMGQHITALRVGLEALQAPGESVERMTRIVERLDQSVDRLTIQLRPPSLDHLGLHGAISSLAEDFSAASGVRVDVHLPGLDGVRFSDPLESTIYRVVQEALTNVWKHSGAKAASIILEYEGNALRLIIEDDGHGFESDGALDGEAVRGRFGLLGIRERLALAGGSLEIESHEGGGTTLYIRVPPEEPKNAS